MRKATSTYYQLSILNKRIRILSISSTCIIMITHISFDENDIECTILNPQFDRKAGVF